MPVEPQKTLEFDSVRLKLASPDVIHKWSHGEVLSPETINYRTQKPERDGLFCEKIFGPSKDWECYCGKYKKIRYKGIICDKCGVEVTRSIVRRERMGHIDLATPVSHIWFLRGIPSKIGLVLDLSVQDLEKVIYFANFIITDVDDAARKETTEQVQEELKNKRKQIEGEFAHRVSEVQGKKSKKLQEGKVDTAKIEKEAEEGILNLNAQKLEKMNILDEAADTAKKELRSLQAKTIISESAYQDLSLKYGHVFEARIGGEAIRYLLQSFDLKQNIKELDEEILTCIPSKKKKLIRRSRLLKTLQANKIKPEWMILTVLPVIPPDLRPMVQLDGGRFATSDLNDLYRRVINRNNRLKRLKELKAPEVIQRNEKRMLQEAVDALIDNNARHGKTVTASTGQKRMLKSIADLLKGKQGRFRQNLLGKRVDYSGRSVIVAGPHLKLDQCGLPQQMALELYRPFVISKLILRELVHNVRSANRYIDEGHAEVWDILDEVTQGTRVLLNRAPTLHRLGIQAFRPILIEGKAIQLHPLVCSAFNADFDGDQMAVHLPLTDGAKKEAEEIMAADRNLLKPATGEPITIPSQDIVWGAYYLTMIQEKKKDQRVKAFSSFNEAELAYKLGYISLQQPIYVSIKNKREETTVGRIIFNEVLPKGSPFMNKTLDKGALKQIVAHAIVKEPRERTVQLLDDIKLLAHKYITRSGLSWGMDDVPKLATKGKLVKEGEEAVSKIREQYNNGLLTDRERYIKVIETWTDIKNRIEAASKINFDLNNSISTIIQSGARGSWAQMIQIMGMKGLVTNPAGDIIELPVKANFQEGLDVLEYFISTHGTRKGLSDTALRTANAGYLTRRLIDVAQDLIVIEEDCKDTDGLVIDRAETEEMNETIGQRIVGRFIAHDIKDAKGKILAKKGSLIDGSLTDKINKTAPEQVTIRSVLSCKSIRGICQKCYGYELGHNTLVTKGTAVGIIAAQSIGEPGTQLTMRTFHTGGVAGGDITQGLPRVEELFEARPPKKKSIIAPIEGQVIIENEALGANKNRIVKIKSAHVTTSSYEFDAQHDRLNVKDGDAVLRNHTLMTKNGSEDIRAPYNGTVKVTKHTVTITGEKNEILEVLISAGYTLWVKNGDLVIPGQQLTEGSIDVHELYHLKNKLAVQKYIIQEIKYIYSSQGQKLNDKHIELIARQMFSRIYVKNVGDTDLLPGEIVTHTQFQEANHATKGTKAQGENLLMGITKASLASDSFLAAASFQETARVLIDAAITGRVDKLRGLKENVIIGRLIPAGTGFKE
ncbi:MAG: DNA-directed RNA polymerase subunit beta' [Candidatus Komeilibacteria bacterium RIFCSPLOWO2_01_FULL_53_11]|uniref:DNA-directed RNA polymerase subunit beta' n=1 Tax=Candidatus Komeilibacteria bacterium RIFCSPLOWO2_01_FULL_53_11 TaxID=1798552 RepID=A0A1G2BPV4_9BACT|nr:MAG: DNA-directed RNA polymerase subunit beta' [Candidatus Komeilibacteria bacterium RIFCSPLOWO2_01_FULL_53_11]